MSWCVVAPCACIQFSALCRIIVHDGVLLSSKTHQNKTVIHSCSDRALHPCAPYSLYGMAIPLCNILHKNSIFNARCMHTRVTVVSLSLCLFEKGLGYYMHAMGRAFSTLVVSFKISSLTSVSKFNLL